MTPDLDGLPDADLISSGLADLQAGRKETVPALLVTIASRRLRDLGLPVPPTGTLCPEPERQLYRRLGASAGPHDDVYHTYNALVRRLVSFAQCLEARNRRMGHAGDSSSP